MTTQDSSDRPGLRLLLEMGPLVVFFVSNAKLGIFAATGIFMVTVVAALAGSWFLERRLPVMPVVTAVFVLIFGGLTLWLQNDLFIKLKPTIVNAMFGTALLVGLALKRSLLKVVLGTSLELTEEGWRQLTLRWGLFFYFLAGLNEFVWRTFETDTWVTFKVFGVMPISIVFFLLQMPLINRHAIAEEAEATPTPGSDRPVE